MLLTHENAEKCRTDMLGICTSSNPIYVASSQDLFRDNKKGVNKIVLWKYWLTLLVSVSLTDGISAVAIKTELQMTQVCCRK